MNLIESIDVFSALSWAIVKIKKNGSLIALSYAQINYCAYFEYLYSTCIGHIIGLKGCKSDVMVDGCLSNPFDVTTGVMQGDVLAPFLFVVLFDYLLKKSTHSLTLSCNHSRRSRRHPTKLLNDLDFADDIAVLESSISQAQVLLIKTTMIENHFFSRQLRWLPLPRRKRLFG